MITKERHVGLNSCINCERIYLHLSDSPAYFKVNHILPTRGAWYPTRLEFCVRIRLGVVYIFALECVILPLLVWCFPGGCRLKIVRSHKLYYVQCVCGVRPMLPTSKRRKGFFLPPGKVKIENAFVLHITRPGPLMPGVYLDLILVLV